MSLVSVRSGIAAGEQNGFIGRCDVLRSSISFRIYGDGLDAELFRSLDNSDLQNCK